MNLSVLSRDELQARGWSGKGIRKCVENPKEVCHPRTGCCSCPYVSGEKRRSALAVDDEERGLRLRLKS